MINGEKKEISFHSSDLLLTLLRDNGFTEVKEGCRQGDCGSCLVLLAGKAVNSCQVLAASAMDMEITTVKGLGTIHEPHIIQRAFVETGAVQCGFCTPGMIIAAYALLKKNPSPADNEIKESLDGNLCRCTGYEKIIDAVKLAAKRIGQDE
ncbi:MAG: 2Fe-2S iron-sulfur cluster binding domain-containing protein [Spirochaeta sp.]|nr:2Fe-2S iron-sulfur cluster binding domain-containing protein [Spirochaeta sp.]